MRTLAVLAVWALVIVGAFMPLFTLVSLVSGTTTVWIGVALTIVGAVAAFVTKRHVATKIIALLLVAGCIAGAISDEVQLQHKRDQLNQLFNN
jgi:general stress protein CsbA